MFYNWSELLTTVKEDIGIKDIPIPVTDEELTDRFKRSALREFSQRYPKLVTDCIITDKDAFDLSTRSVSGCIRYTIPEKYYYGSEILAIVRLNPGGYGSEANMYMPNVVLGSADLLIESIADIKLAAALGQQMAHAPTFEFEYPNKVTIYNGWASGSYRLELALTHDLTLSTVPPTAMKDLRQLVTYDIEWMLYNKMKRLTNIDTGVGQIDLKIDNWEGAEANFRDLLERWDQDSTLDWSSISWF